MEPARVSSPQVDLTRCGLDKTPTLLVLQCPGATRSAEGEEVHSWDAGPRWQSRGEARPRAEVGDHIPPSTGKRDGYRPIVVLPSPPPPVGEDHVLEEEEEEEESV